MDPMNHFRAELLIKREVFSDRNEQNYCGDNTAPTGPVYSHGINASPDTISSTLQRMSPVF